MRRGRPHLERHNRRATPTVTRSPRRSLGRFAQPRLGEVGGVRVARRLAAHDTHTGSARSARDQLLDPSVVEACTRAPAILGEHLGEIAPGVQGMAQGAFEDV